MQNQIFYVFYKDESFVVDPSLLYNSSRKFKELVDHADNLQSIHLKINYEQFSTRNVVNFLRLCQNEPTDVQNSELEEICLIAKMFQAEKIYNTGLEFIQNHIDSNFYFPNDKYEDQNYLILEKDEISPIHHADLNELEFDDDDDFESQKESEATGENNMNINNDQKLNDQIPDKKLYRTARYEITYDRPFLKCKRFYLKKDDQVICMAKQKDDEIYIGDGNDFHISENNSKKYAKITRTRNRFNVVMTDEQEFKIKYVKNGNNDSIELSFNHDGQKLEWRPKIAKSIKSYKGGYGRSPILSKKNMILQNYSNKSTFIVRKMAKNVYEAECNPNVKPMIVFAIALSQIVGPL